MDCFYFLRGIIGIRGDNKNNGHISFAKFHMDNDNNSVEGVIVRSLNAKHFLFDAIMCLFYSISRSFDAIDGLM